MLFGRGFFQGHLIKIVKDSKGIKFSKINDFLTILRYFPSLAPTHPKGNNSILAKKG
jgi:hypothetical protein